MRADARLIARNLATPHNRYRRFSFSELTYRQRSMGIQESSIGLERIGLERIGLERIGLESSPKVARLKKTGVRESRTPESISKSLCYLGFRTTSEPNAFRLLTEQ